METKDYLKILVEEIHSVVIATCDDNGLPCTRVIDLMLHDDDAVYFLTAKGKAFYDQLLSRAYISLSALTNGDNTMVKKAISISGAVRNIGTEKLDEIFEKNPYMSDLYKTDEQRSALEVFCLYKGQGEFFDLSTKPITRASFALGKEIVKKYGFFITSTCSECGKCASVCPTSCIDSGSPFTINSEHCLHCGNCMAVCPDSSVVKASN